MSIGDNVKTIRNEKKLTQEVLAKQMGISRSYLSDIENNRKNPSSKTIEALAEKLDVSMLYLTTGQKALRDLTDEELKDDFEKIQEKVKLKNKNINEFIKQEFVRLSEAELDYTVSQYLANMLIFLRNSNDTERKKLTVFVVQLIKYRNAGNDKDVNHDELLEFIEGEASEYKEFLKEIFNYKEGD